MAVRGGAGDDDNGHTILDLRMSTTERENFITIINNHCDLVRRRESAKCQPAMMIMTMMMMMVMMMIMTCQAL